MSIKVKCFTSSYSCSPFQCALSLFSSYYVSSCQPGSRIPIGGEGLPDWATESNKLMALLTPLISKKICWMMKLQEKGKDHVEPLKEEEKHSSNSGSS